MVAGWHGFSFNPAQPFFEALQGGKEANVTTEAEKYGIQKGLNLYDALDTKTKELESIRDSHKQPGDW